MVVTAGDCQRRSLVARVRSLLGLAGSGSRTNRRQLVAVLVATRGRIDGPSPASTQARVAAMLPKRVIVGESSRSWR